MLVATRWSHHAGKRHLGAAESAGRQRQAANHRTVLINLDKIITSLQSLRTERGKDG